MPISRAIPTSGRSRSRIEELHFFSSEVTVLGTYPASPFRAELKALEG